MYNPHRGVYSAARSVMAGIALAVAAHGSVQAAPADTSRWMTYTSENGTLKFTYPAGVFTEKQGDPTEPLKARTPDRDGRTFVSADGSAVLQIGTFPISTIQLLRACARRALAASYSDAKINYSRSANTWYALSGTRGTETFYERVHFSCNNRRVDIWAMTYPDHRRGRVRQHRRKKCRNGFVQFAQACSARNS